MNPNQPTTNASHRGDLELVQEALRRRPAAIDELIARLRCVPLILHERNVRSGWPLNDEDLTELTQATLITVWNKLASFEGRSTLETWVYSFCMHQMFNALRSKRRRPQLAGDSALDFPAPESAPAPTLEYEHVYACLERLEDAQAAIIRLKHFSALTFDEIAARLTLSPGTVKTLYYRGLERLRGLLGPHLRGELA